MSGGAFTWSNNQNSPTLEKLDRIIVTREWEMLFPTIHVHKEDMGMSDHNPLFLVTQVVKSGGRRDFRFELTWLRHPNFLQKIKTTWDEPNRDRMTLDKVQFKLKKVKKILKGGASIWLVCRRKERKRS
jgi:hypothetical protein